MDWIRGEPSEPGYYWCRYAFTDGRRSDVELIEFCCGDEPLIRRDERGGWEHWPDRTVLENYEAGKIAARPTASDTPQPPR